MRVIKRKAGLASIVALALAVAASFGGVATATAFEQKASNVDKTYAAYQYVVATGQSSEKKNDQKYEVDKYPAANRLAMPARVGFQHAVMWHSPYRDPSRLYEVQKARDAFYQKARANRLERNPLTSHVLA